MLEIRNLSVSYPGREVLKNIDLTVPSGQVTVILGPNGCGKSTLLKALCGILSPAGGEITLDGDSLLQLSPKLLARKVAYLAQSRPVSDITVQRLVLHGRFPYLRYPRRYRKEDHAIAREAMAQVGILEYAHTPLPKLSGGTRQKAYIAMALAQDTDAVLLDEPNAYLDIAHQLQLMDLCRELARRGKAVAIVLHDLNLAMEHADRLAVLKEGALIALGDPETIYQTGALDQAFGVSVHRSRTPAGWQYSCRLKEKEN